jgi:hypothetical protein
MSIEPTVLIRQYTFDAEVLRELIGVAGMLRRIESVKKPGGDYWLIETVEITP